MPRFYRNSVADVNPVKSANPGNSSNYNFSHNTIVFIAAFLVYAWSAPVTVVLEDDGFFILEAYFNGIAHPPGYPLYTLLAHLTTLVPVGSIALRVHLLSGFLGALACICLWQITYVLLRDKTAAYATALSLAYSRVFWSQAIIAEVYTLNVCLVLIIFLAVLSARNHVNARKQERAIQLLFFCYGLALSNHWPLVVLTTPMFIAALWQIRNKLPRYSMQGLPYLLLGLTPYLWMAIRSQMNPEIMFFGPIENLSDFWHYLSRQPYADIDFSTSAGWIDKLQFLEYVLHQTREQYGPFGWLFILAGLVYQWRRLPVDVCVALLLGYSGSTVFLVLLLGFDYDGYHEVIFQVYPLISYAIAAIWLGIGVTFITNLLAKTSLLKYPGRIIPAALAVLIAGSSLAVNAVWNYRHNDQWGRLYAVNVLDLLPRGALLFTDGLAEGAIAYINNIEEYRNDITLYSVRGILFNNRLFKQLRTDDLQSNILIKEFIKKETRPIFYISNLRHEYGNEFNGLYHKVLKNEKTKLMHGVIIPQVLAYWNFILEAEPRDPWEKLHRRVILREGCYLLNSYGETQGHNVKHDDHLEELHTRLCDNLDGTYIMIEAILERETPDWNILSLLLKRADKQINEAMLKSQISDLDYYRGIMYLRRGDREKGRYFLEQSLLKWNHPDNKAYNELQKVNR